MDYNTLLLKLQNLLQSLQLKGINYLNVENNPKLELSELISELREISIKRRNKFKKNSEFLNNRSREETSGKIIYQNNVDNTVIKHNQIAINIEKDRLLSLNDLHEKFKTCQKCKLAETRKNIVFGCGNSASKIMFIGEGPGAEEDQIGEPFVGRAGKLLTKMINSIGIERKDVFITNVVKCRPPQNRNPTEKELSSCLPILKNQIGFINPKLIVTLGNVPTKTLIPDIPGITKVHGKIQRYETWNMLPTFHPSYLLRNRSTMQLAWEDFKRIPELAF